MYYAIEGCRLPTPVTAVLPSTAASSMSAPTKVSDRTNGSHRDGIIAGTIVAAISAIALILIGLLMLMQHTPKIISGAAQELPGDHALVETLSVEKQPAQELWGDHVAVEIGRNSQDEPLMENLVNKRETNEGREEMSHPIIRIHLAS